MAKAEASPTDAVQRELDAIKRLMILGLLERGLSQGQVANALDVNQATISRMFPKGLKLGKKKG